MAIQLIETFRRYPSEAEIVGRLLSAFGEIEFVFLSYARRAADIPHFPFLRAMYRLRATSARINAADALMQPVFEVYHLKTEYDEALKAVRYCLKIRNQFSHCNWADNKNSPGSGLFFIDLEHGFEHPEEFDLHWRPIDPIVLTEHEEYFAYTLEVLRWIDDELVFRRGLVSFNPWSKPLPQKQPSLHTSASQRIPSWLSEDQKLLYLARASAAERGVPAPTPKQQALDKARAEKRAKKAADRL